MKYKYILDDFNAVHKCKELEKNSTIEERTGFTNILILGRSFTSFDRNQQNSSAQIR